MLIDLNDGDVKQRGKKDRKMKMQRSLGWKQLNNSFGRENRLYQTEVLNTERNKID